MLFPIACVYKTVGSLAHDAVEVKSINWVKKAIRQIYGGKVPGGLLKAKEDFCNLFLDNAQQKYHSLIPIFPHKHWLLLEVRGKPQQTFGLIQFGTGMFKSALSCPRAAEHGSTRWPLLQAGDGVTGCLHSCQGNKRLL